MGTSGRVGRVCGGRSGNVLGFDSFFNVAEAAVWFGLGVEERGVPNVGVVSRFDTSRTIGLGGNVSAWVLSPFVAAMDLDLPSWTSPSSASAVGSFVLLALLIGLLVSWLK